MRAKLFANYRIPSRAVFLLPNRPISTRSAAIPTLIPAPSTIRHPQTTSSGHPNPPTLHTLDAKLNRHPCYHLLNASEH